MAGLVYELIAGTLSSYLLGDSVRQFSLVIGVFLAAMGAGAWASRFVGDEVRGFAGAQVALGLIGGFLAPLIYLAYASFEEIGLPLYGGLVLIGVLSGMEIPLLARILKRIGAPAFRFETVLSADYLGALAASVAFPILIVPHLGLMTASLAFGTLNLLVAGLSMAMFRDRVGRGLWAAWALSLLVTVAGLAQAERLVSAVEASLFEDEVILSETAPYQHISITRLRDRVRLFLDHSIQFDTLNEHRCHEALVHPAFALVPRARTVLILGGGDGLAAREVLRHPQVEAVTLVDLDGRVTELVRDRPELAALDGGALSDPRVSIVTEDAWQWVEAADAAFDVVIADLPDPKSIALSRLYTREFYALLAERVSAQGALVVQAGSPLFAREAYWSVVRTLEATRNPTAPGGTLHVIPYHVYLPSFGDWGFALASPRPLATDAPLALPQGLRFLTDAAWRASLVFAPDESRVEAAVNTLEGHPLPACYEAGWARWFE